MPLSSMLTRAVGEFIDNLAPYRELIASRRDAMAGGSVSFRMVELLLTDLVRFRADIVDLKGRTGVLAYVRRLYGDTTFDIVARLNAVQTAVEATGTSIRTLMPKDASGWVLAYQLAVDLTSTEQFVYRTVTPAQSAATRTNLDTIIAAIDALIDDLTV